MDTPRPIFERNFPVRWNDMDAFGHVTHSLYFEYCSQTRIDWFASIGRDIVDGDTGPVIVHTDCSYRTPIEFPAIVNDRFFVTQIGKSSFKARHEVRAQGSDALCAEHHATIVWCNFKTGRSVALPAWLQAALCAAIG